MPQAISAAELSVGDVLADIIESDQITRTIVNDVSDVDDGNDVNDVSSLNR